MEEFQPFIRYCFIGIGATIVMDIWALALRRIWNIPSLDYALVGRWVGHLRTGKWFHSPITSSPPFPGEQILGLGLHYAIGIIFAVVFGMMTGPEWLAEPDFPSALLFGGLTVVFPFFVMQPALGAGVAAAKTPAPTSARLKSIGTHLVFGIGLWLSAITALQL